MKNEDVPCRRQVNLRQLKMKNGKVGEFGKVGESGG
jgi:hypothetical protein